MPMTESKKLKRNDGAPASGRKTSLTAKPPNGTSGIIARQRGQEQREGDVIPKLAGERPQRAVGAVGRKVNLLEIKDVADEDAGAVMAREQRQIVKIGVGQEIAAEAVDEKVRISAGTVTI